MFSISDVFAMIPTDTFILYWAVTVLFGVGFSCGLVSCIISSSFHLEDGSDKLKVALMLVFLVGFIAIIYLPFYDQEMYDMKYKQILTINAQSVYTETDLLETYEVHRAKGLYRVDTSKMTKELYMDCIHGSVNPYEVIVVTNSK